MSRHGKNNPNFRHGHGADGKPSPTYRVWVKMLARVRGTADKRLEKRRNYDLRGISVCGRWLKFENFLADMGERPSLKHSIDRKNNNKGYTKSNCRWATMKEQIRNRRNNHKVRAFGKNVTIAEWSEITGLGWNTIIYRIRAGWPTELALTSKTTR